jgi:uncharacterized small protein (DUF1192 family)
VSPQTRQVIVVETKNALNTNRVPEYVAFFNPDGSVYSFSDKVSQDSLTKLEERFAVLEDRIAALEAAAEAEEEVVEDPPKTPHKATSKAAPKTH